MLGGLLFRGPRRVYTRTASLVLARLPETSEPAMDQVRRLTKEPKVRTARRDFKAKEVVAPAEVTASTMTQAEVGVPATSAARAS